MGELRLRSVLKTPIRAYRQRLTSHSPLIVSTTRKGSVGTKLVGWLAGLGCGYGTARGRAFVCEAAAKGGVRTLVVRVADGAGGAGRERAGWGETSFLRGADPDSLAECSTGLRGARCLARPSYTTRVNMPPVKKPSHVGSRSLVGLEAIASWIVLPESREGRQTVVDGHQHFSEVGQVRPSGPPRTAILPPGP